MDQVELLREGVDPSRFRVLQQRHEHGDDPDGDRVRAGDPVQHGQSFKGELGKNLS